MSRKPTSYTESIIMRGQNWILPIWGIFAALMLFLMAQGVPLSYESRLQDAADLFSEPLAAWGLPLAFYPVYLLTLEFVLIAISLLAGLYLLLVSRDNRIATIAAFFMMIWVASWNLPYIEAGSLYPLPIAVIDVVGNFVYATLLLTFPTGRIQAKWVRPLLPGGFLILFIVTPINSLAETNPSQGALTQLILFGITAFAVVLQIIRYRYHSTREEKQQSKWAFVGFVSSYAIPIGFLIADAFLSPYIVDFPTIRFIYRLMSSTFFIFLPFTLIPVTMLFAVTKSRLWQIDLLLNKAAVSAGVTLILLILFTTGVAITQAVSGNLLLATISTLLIIAIAFYPLQSAVQNLLDRRIFGLRFDLNQLQRAQIPREITNPGQFSGTMLDTYEILNVIDRGGMGEVYQGIGKNQAVAIKTVLPEMAQDSIFRERFNREVRAGNLLNHPNIIQVLDSGESDGTSYLVMDYIEGQHLKKRMNKQPVDLAEAIRIFSDIAEALAYAHEQGITHRDVKPENIMIREDGSAVLIDFGLVKFADDTQELSGKGAIGTIDYMAPEQIRSAGKADGRADIYAMGVVLYEMLTGRTPFGGNAGQILFAHLSQPPPDPCTFGMGIPAHICEAIQRALMKDPDDRYASIKDFMDVVAMPEYV